MARILLIDDGDTVRTMLRETLQHVGHAVIEARDGTEGLALFQHAAADLVITDIVMSDKEGFEVLGTLRDAKRRLRRGRSPEDRSCSGSSAIAKPVSRCRSSAPPRGIRPRA